MCFSALYLYWNTVEKLNILDLPVLGRTFAHAKDQTELWLICAATAGIEKLLPFFPLIPV